MKACYTAKNQKGENRAGEANVKDERDLATQLRADGFVLTSFKEVVMEKEKNISVKFLDRFSSVPISEKMMFTRNLSVMISSGLPLSRAIRNLTVQTKNKKFAKILGEIQSELQSGATLSDGLAKYPGVFDELFVNMIRVGETSGNLEEVLNILAIQLEKEHELIGKVRGALIYPAVILVAMIAIGIVMMVFVVPKLTQVFKDLGSDLPATTKFVIATSDFLKNNFLLSLVGFVILAVLAKIYTTTDSGKKTMGFLFLNLPAISNIYIKMNSARFSRILSSLLRSGVTIVESLRILSRTLTNHYYRTALEKASEMIQKGEPLSKIIYQEKKIFPILVPQMLEVGEETGKTETVMQKLADFYEDEVNQLTRNLSSIIEPVLMLIIGAAVGFFAVSMLTPMYSVMQNIK